MTAVVVLLAVWLLLWGGIGARTGLVNWRPTSDFAMVYLICAGATLWAVYLCFWPGLLTVDPAGVHVRRPGTRRIVHIPWEDIRAARVHRDHGPARLLVHLATGPTEGRRVTGLRYDPGTRAHRVATLARLGAAADALATTLAGYVPRQFPDVAGTPEGDLEPPRFAWRGRRATPGRISLTVLLGVGLLGAVWGLVGTPGRDRFVPGGFVLLLGVTLVVLWQDTVPYLIIDGTGIRYTSEATLFRDAAPVELLWEQVAGTAVAGPRWGARLLVQPVGSPRDRAALTGAGFGHRDRRYAVCRLRPVRADPDHVRAALSAHGHRLTRSDATG